MLLDLWLLLLPFVVLLYTMFIVMIFAPCVVDVLNRQTHDVELNIKIEDVFTMVEPTNNSNNNATQ